MLLDLGVLKLAIDRTKRKIFPYLKLVTLKCSVYPDERDRILKRVLKT